MPVTADAYFSLATAVLGIIWLLASPALLSAIIPYARRAAKNCYRALYAGYLMLGVNITVSGVTAWHTTEVAYKLIGPSIFGVTSHNYDIDGTLTPRLLLFMLFVFVTPLIVFSKVGVPSVRDTHQNIKMLRDISSSHDRKRKNNRSHSEGRLLHHGAWRE